MSTSDTAPRFLTPAQVADEYGIPVGTLADWRLKRTGPAYSRLGSKRVRYTRASLEAWIAANTVTPAGR